MARKSIRGSSSIHREAEDSARLADAPDTRDYDVDHYVRVLRDNFAERLSRALRPEHFAAIVSDPEQPTPFDESFADETTILTRHG